MRQAAEWGPRYKFWSCADVDILPSLEEAQQCGEGGRLEVSTGRCVCERLRYWRGEGDCQDQRVTVQVRGEVQFY